MIRQGAAILLCCLFAVTAGAQSKKNKKSLSVFSVNKKTVTADEFVYLYKKNHQNKPEEFTKEKIQEYLDLFINFKLKVEEARSRGLDTTAAFRKEFNSYKEELRKPYLPDNKLSDSLAHLTYNRMKEEINASHILLYVKPDASQEDTLLAFNKILDIRKRALAGEDFGTLVSQYSEEPSAKTTKGNLGYFTALQMVYQFENAAYNTKTGEVSQPVRTRFGYHLVKVEARRPSTGEIEVSHIMIRTGDGKDNEKAKNLIFEIYDKLRAGVAWDELCKQYTEDLGSKEAGGKLRAFGVGGMASIPTFERAAFSLRNPGELSDPFLSQYGWHIVRLEKKIPMPTYEEIATTLKSKVNRDERTQLSKQALQLKLRKDFGLKEIPAVKSKILSLADTSLRSGKWKIESAQSDKEILMQLQNKPVFTREFLAYAQKNQRPNSQAPEKYFESLYNNFIDTRITQLLEERIVQQNPDFNLLLNEYYEGILLFDIMEKEVWNKASEDSVGQERYFTTNKGDYKAGERAKTTLYSSTSKDLIMQLRTKIVSGDTSKLKDFISSSRIREESASFEKEEKSILSKVSWSKGIYTEENNGTHYLVCIKDILSPGQKTFQEARPAVISDYQNYLEKTWIEALKKKYPVKLNEKGKANVFSQLQAK